MNHLPGVHAPFMVRVAWRSSGFAGRPIPAGEARAGRPRPADAADAPERLRGTRFRRLAPPPAGVVRAPVCCAPRVPVTRAAPTRPV